MGRPVPYLSVGGDAPVRSDAGAKAHARAGSRSSSSRGSGTDCGTPENEPLLHREGEREGRGRPAPYHISAKDDDAAGGDCCCGDADDGAGQSGFLPPFPEAMAAAFDASAARAMAPEELDRRTAKLIGVALSVATKCGPCVKVNVRGAREAGATDAEIGAAAGMGAFFGGAAAARFYQGISNKE